MKIINIVLSSCLFLFVRGLDFSRFNETMIIGDWKQLYSNRFVQDTSEIDWDCVDVHVSRHLEIQKSPLIHHQFYSSYPLKIRLENPREEDDKFIFDVENNLFLQYEIRDFVPNEYIVWTLNDEISMFVWTKNIKKFNETYEDHVFRNLDLWEYNTYYKEPIACYTDFCAHRHLRNHHHFSG